MHSAWADPAQRQQRLTDERRRKMARSAHAYVRGSTTQFYHWLEASNRVTLPEGPPIWICGDCHVGNLGPIASGDGALDVQIRDLDQTVIGNPAHDLIRLALSLAMAARGSDLPGVTTAHMLECMIEGYAAAFAAPAHDNPDVADMPRSVRIVMRRAARRSWKHLADERIEGVEPVIPLGTRFWPLSADERAGVDTLCTSADMRRLVETLKGGADDEPVRVMDAAYWRKGCSSLGRLRLAVLACLGAGKHQRHCLLDIKEAIAPAAPCAASAAMPADNAERVVLGARALSPHLGERMIFAPLLDRAVFVRALLPQDLKLEIEHTTREEAMAIATFLAGVVGRAHARQMDPGQQSSWQHELAGNRSTNLDAPSWLWNSVVELVSLHEAAYLNHCRRYALADAA